jgi:formyl-CoA transferase
MMLADLGAEVIKVEQPGTGDGSRAWGPPWAGAESAYYLSVNRNKKSICLNLGKARGRDILRSLAQSSDILIENFYVGTMKRWALDFQELRKDNPGLIYCSITGYGQDGPYHNRPGYDFIIQAQGGIMSITGPADGPPCKVGVAVVDITAGLYAAVAILAALHARASTGEGQFIDIALLDSQVAWLANVASNYLISGDTPARYGNAHPNIVPYQAFEASDRWFALAVGNDLQFARLCAMLNMSALANDPRFATNPKRVENRESLISILGMAFRSERADFWLSRLLKAGIPCSPINTIDQVLRDDQVRARGMVLEIPHPTAGTIQLVASPLNLSRTPIAIKAAPPLLGQHTHEVLSNILGYDDMELDNLRSEGVIA